MKNICRMIFAIPLALLLPCAAFSETQPVLKNGAEIYPVRPDGQRDWQADHYRVENGDAVPIRPDGQRDWNANSYHVDGEKVVPVRPDGQRDWQAPAMQINGK